MYIQEIYSISCLRSVSKILPGQNIYTLHKKTGACLFNACIKCKIRYPIRTQVQWFIFYAITQS